MQITIFALRWPQRFSPAPSTTRSSSRRALRPTTARVVSIRWHRMQSIGDARNCTTYDSWPYGLKNRTGYTAKLSEDQLKQQLAARSVTYLLGEIDILPLGGFDSSCPAMAQGSTRLARGQVFASYVATKYKAAHKTVVVPLCGHNARCMFTSEIALPILFPKI